jgi:hypothetical protein
MASKTKAELQTEILLLNPEADTEGLTNKELEAMLAELTETETGYRVAEGNAIATLAGIKVGGEGLEPKFFSNGAEDIARLVAAGLVVESA